METMSLLQEIITEDGGRMWCTYRMIQEPDLENGGCSYGIRCCLEGMQTSVSEHSYTEIHHISSHEEKVEDLIRFLAKKQVLPVHIKDMISDLLG